MTTAPNRSAAVQAMARLATANGVDSSKQCLRLTIATLHTLSTCIADDLEKQATELDALREWASSSGQDDVHRVAAVLQLAAVILFDLEQGAS